MKLLTIFSLAVVLAAGSSSAAAKERHRDGHKKQIVKAAHHGSHHYKNSHRKRNDRAQHQSARRHLGQHRSYWHRSNQHNWRYSNHGSWRYKYNYYPTLFSASILGSVIGHHLYHTHDGAVCYDKHEDQRQNRSSSDTEVVGCHRVEQLPNGLERRVEVPLAECN